ncbi:MAG: 2OG-Fe(II) oxygenase [Myxococcales bacterium]|nr:2OG-Fe(II) oxygenase [Myxococcales bacterium]
MVLDDLLGAPAADGIRAAVLEAEVQGRLHPAGLGRTRARQEELRSDLHGWIDPDDADPRLAPLLGFFAELRVRLSREAFLGLRRFEVQAAVYHEGCGYVRHADAFRGGPSRRVTAIYYANPEWTPRDGGELCCWPSAAALTIEPRHDRMVVFLSERLEHEVRPVTRGPRVAVTAWYWGP